MIKLIWIIRWLVHSIKKGVALNQHQCISKIKFNRPLEVLINMTKSLDHGFSQMKTMYLIIRSFKSKAKQILDLDNQDNLDSLLPKNVKLILLKELRVLEVQELVHHLIITFPRKKDEYYLIQIVSKSLAFYSTNMVK